MNWCGDYFQEGLAVAIELGPPYARKGLQLNEVGGALGCELGEGPVVKHHGGGDAKPLASFRPPLAKALKQRWVGGRTRRRRRVGGDGHHHRFRSAEPCPSPRAELDPRG